MAEHCGTSKEPKIEVHGGTWQQSLFSRHGGRVKELQIYQLLGGIAAMNTGWAWIRPESPNYYGDD